MTETVKDPSISVLGAGAFGTALACTLAAQGRSIRLWGRDAGQMAHIAQTRENRRYLPDVSLPATVMPCAEMSVAAASDVLLLAVPTQSLRGLIAALGPLAEGKTLVICCKGVETGTGLLPTEIVQTMLPLSSPAVLTGPSFAIDIARGKPTALTLASSDGPALQRLLSTPTLRLYHTPDVIGAQLGGALKNVIAIAAGITIGAGLGDSARAALMTRGFAEMTRYAQARGADPATLYGLSGFGDLVLTCTSDLSRNFRHGFTFARQGQGAPQGTVEGVMTAHAIAAARPDLDLPITRAVSALLDHRITLPEALGNLMARPLRGEG
jgi:glycerol-3-phosphate dehydrogenase (NAD(P)+)